MAFGLKNAIAMYQSVIQYCMRHQLGRNVEAYIDDIVVKTKNPEDLIKDLAEMFANLRKFQ